MMKTAIVLTVVLLIAAPIAAQDSCAISLDTALGAVEGRIPLGAEGVSFRLRGQNLAPDDVRGLTNGFRIYGDDPAVQWNPLDYGYHYELLDFFPLVMETYPFSWDGSGADTLGFGGAAMLNFGMPAGWDEEIFWISLSITDPAAAGHQLCLDSCWYPPTGSWMWGYGSGVGSFPPRWDGPYCYEILSCCDGMRGNIDCDASGEITIADLVYLVAYMFSGGPAPIDMATADFFDDGSGDIGDLIHLIEYMFNGGAAPPDCP